ncbi:MAG: copper chaperone PCu(A)C [Brachybacterium alimentarium]
MSRTTRTPFHPDARSVARSAGRAPAGPTSGAAARAVPRRAALASLLVLPLAACSAGGADGGDGGDDSATGASDGGADATASGSITVTDPWVKAADDGMTAAFGTVVNGTGSDLVLTAVTTPATDMVQLHETTSDGSGGMSMQEKEDGFELPAGAELVLEPGGDHIMLMDLPEPLQPGDEIELTLVFSEGTEYPFTATVKDFTGAEENYAPGEGDEASDGGGEHDEHGDHGDHDAEDAHSGHAEHGEDQ